MADDFEREANRVIESIEAALDAAAVDVERKGDGVLEIEFEDQSRIIVNRHLPAKEIWLASRTAGQHFRWDGGAWVDTRTGEELMAALSRAVSAQAGIPVVLGGTGAV